MVRTIFALQSSFQLGIINICKSKQNGANTALNIVLIDQFIKRKLKLPRTYEPTWGLERLLSNDVELLYATGLNICDIKET